MLGKWIPHGIILCSRTLGGIRGLNVQLGLTGLGLMSRQIEDLWECQLGNRQGFLVCTIVPPGSIFRSWEWDRGPTFGTWGIVFNVTIASQGCQAPGNKYIRFDNMLFMYALSQLSKSMSRIA